MGKERVLIVHNYYQLAGGEDTVVRNEKELLEENNHKVFLYTRHNDEIKNSNSFKKILQAIESVYSFRTIREVKKIIRDNDIDVVHVHNTFPLISPSIYKAAKMCNVKVIQTLHNFRLLCPGGTFTRNGNICEDCLSNGLKCAIKNKCYRNSRVQTFMAVLMMKFNRTIGSYKNVDRYIALTDFNKDKLSNLIDKDKICIKPNFSMGECKDILYSNEREYFIFVGRLEKLKGIDILIKSWDKVIDEKLIIVGNGPLENWIKNYIQENDIKNIELLGYVENKKVMDLIVKAKALILPSQCYEGFPMSIIEALSAGVQVIGSNLGNVGSIINDNNVGQTFIYNDENDLANIVNCFSRNKLNNKDIDNCKKTFDEKYSKDINYKQLIDIYQLN